VIVTPDTIQDTVTAIIANQLFIEKNTIKGESRFVEDLQADTLDVLEWILEIENDFGIEFPDQDVEKINSVAELVNLISLRLIPTQS
jgi:acyl carrier protein